MSAFDGSWWSGRRVFVTGHMGFKGAWLCALLQRLGAYSFGFGHDPRDPLLYSELKIERHVSRNGDVNDLEALTASLADSGAEVVFHLAAQPLVLASYKDPLGTFQTNVIGTANVLHAARSLPSLKAVVVVTSDKVYRNTGTMQGYREEYPLGGVDPYSASKAAAEIVTQSMSASYFSKSEHPRIATARAGNVIGGGDWARDRLLPDAARALSAGEPFIVRNPDSTRPWQHVLDPLAGYLMLAQRAASGGSGSDALNFGPAHEGPLTVREVADLFVEAWGPGSRWSAASQNGTPRPEAATLTLDSSRANRELGWTPRWTSRQAIARAASWYREHAAGVGASKLVERDISDFLGG